jgi:hypothetical protein
MSAASHPSSDALSGYLDRELPPQSLAEIEQHLSGCAECRGLLEAFTFMNALGPMVELSLPGEAYWADLPDRILVRLAENPAPAPERSRSFWQRLWQPQGAWRYAMGTVAALAVVAGAWTVVHRSRGITEPTETNVAENTNAPMGPIEATPVNESLIAEGPTIPFGAPPAEDRAPGMSPESFARRVIVTLGGPNNPGTSLNISSANPAAVPIPNSGIGTQVDYSLPPLSPQSLAATKGVVTLGPGQSWSERAYMCALKAEEVGNVALARQGYRVVMQHTDPGSVLNWASGYRLTMQTWRERMLAAHSGVERARTLADLGSLASRSYADWESSGGMTNCQTAWCLNRVFSELAAEMVSPTERQQAAARAGELSRCITAP